MEKILKLGRKLREKEMSCVELTKAYLDAAEKLNPELRAYITITHETALAAAAEADKKLSSSDNLPPLLGIPFVLKDNIATSGLKTTSASKILENHVPLYDGAVWEYLKEQGAVLIGKGNLDELSMGSTGSTSYFGQALNPHDTSRFPGGSSGGVAVAVASGTAAFGIGTDTGGSIRQPASLCGLVGMKPTYGAVSRHGLFALASSLDQIGPMTTSVRDTALVLDAISVQDKRDMMSRGLKPVSDSLTGDIKGAKIGILQEFNMNLSPDVDKATQNALKCFEVIGASLVDLSFPLLHYSVPAYCILTSVEAASNLGCFDGIRYGYRAKQYENIEDLVSKTRGEAFGIEVKRRAILGTYFSSAVHYDTHYNKAIKLRNAFKNEFNRLFDECDFIISPTLPTTAEKFGVDRGIREYCDDLNNVAANLAGLPAVSIPCGFDSDNLPIGLQIIGNKFCDGEILNAALAFETETAGTFQKDLKSGVAF